MNPLELFCFLNNLSFSYDKEITKTLSFVFSENLENILRENSINFEIKNSLIVIEKRNLPFTFFEDFNEFKDQIKLEDYNKPIIIQNYVTGQTIYYSNEFTSDIISQPDNDDYYITNARTYLESLSFFKKQFSENESNFEFVDFYSESSKTIVFASISEKKRVKFSFSSTGIVEMNCKINYFPKFEEFKSLMTESKQYAVFLKKSLIKNIINSSENSYITFFNKIDQILSEAKLDFNVYLHELSIDKIKAEYKDYKDKFLSSQNEILNKLTNQIIALPLSISATVFAITRLEDKSMPLFILCFGLLCYIIYITFLIKFFIRDIHNLNKQSNNDYEYLSEQSFFTENSNELTYFKEIKSFIDRRLNDLYLGLKIFTIIMWLSSFLIILYVLSFLVDLTNFNRDIFLFTIPVLILLFLFSEVLFKDKLNVK